MYRSVFRAIFLFSRVFFRLRKNIFFGLIKQLSSLQASNCRMTIANKPSIHQHLLTIDGMNLSALRKSRALVCMLFGEKIFYFTLDKKRIVDNTVEKF